MCLNSKASTFSAPKVLARAPYLDNLNVHVATDLQAFAQKESAVQEAFIPQLHAPQPNHVHVLAVFAMARLVSENCPGFVNEKGQWPRQLQTMMTDGVAIVIGSLLGTSPLTGAAWAGPAAKGGIAEGAGQGCTPVGQVWLVQ